MRIRRFNAAFLLAVSAVLYLAGCAGKTPDPETEAPVVSTREKAILSGRRNEASQFIRDLMTRKWEYWVYGRDFDFQKLYADHAGLFSGQTIVVTEKVMDALPPDNERGHKQLEYFRRFVLREIVQKQMDRFDSEIYSLLDSAVIQIGDATAPYAAVSYLLENEPDYNMRRTIASESTKVLRLVNSRYQIRMDESANLATSIGYDSVISLASDMREMDIPALAAQCETLLTLTDDIYREQLRRFAEEHLGIPIASLGRADLPMVFGFESSFDPFFPEEDSIAVCNTSLSRMGIDLNFEQGLSLDTEARPNKNPAPQAFPILVPTDVRVSLAPLPGLRACEQMLRELAKGLFYANARNQVWEFGILGGRTDIQAYSDTLASIVNEPAWIATYTGISPEDRGEYIRIRALSELLQMRRACAKFLYELDYRRGVENPRESYREHLSRAYGLRLDDEDTERYLADADPFFDGAPTIVGRWMAAMLVEHFRAANGDKWYESPRTGLELRTLWSKGTEPTPEDILKEAGLGAPGPEAFAREMQRMLATN